jgi:hypothetical protein
VDTEGDYYLHRRRGDEGPEENAGQIKSGRCSATARSRPTRALREELARRERIPGGGDSAGARGFAKVKIGQET